MDTFKTTYLPDSTHQGERRCFTRDEANQTLPLVQRIVDDILKDFELLRELYQVCRSFGPHGDSLESEAARQQYASVNDHLAELTEELEALGCVLQDYQAGIVAFPGRIEDQPSTTDSDVIYHWRPGDERVALAN